MQYNQAILNMPQYPFAHLAAVRKRLIDSGKKVYDFSKGDPIEPTAKVIREALVSHIPEISQYPAVKGLPELRSTISKYVQKRFSVSLDPETQILQCNGTKEALFNLSALTIGKKQKKDIVVGSVPGFMVIERSALVHGAEFYGAQINPGNNFLLELSELPKEVLERCALAVINYPNNPTGARCDLSYLKRQVDTAKRFGILLCSDECYVELYLDDKPAPSILEISTEGVLALQSCSKRSGMTGYRTGFIAGDKEALKHFLTIRDSMGTETPVFVQHAAIAAWNDENHVRERRRIFNEKRRIIAGFMDSKGLKYLDSSATFYLWVEVPQGYSGATYAERLLQLGIIVTPGAFFGGDSDSWVRIALVPSVEQCVEAVALWKNL